MLVLDFFKVSLVLILVIAFVIGIGVAIIKFIDYLEENPYGSKKLIEYILYTAVACHILFLFIGISIPQILFSLSIQYAYHCLFDAYPIIKPEDPKFIYGLVASLVNYFLMIRFISTYNPGLLMIVPCFIIIWITPVCFFFSMSATEDTLFIKTKGKTNVTYAGKFIDWIFKLGREAKALKNRN